MNVVVTGAGGFIGSALCSQLSSDNKLIGIDYKKDFAGSKDFVTKQTDLTDFKEVTELCKEHSSDVIIHCAGVAHQKIGAVDSATYIQVNSEATENFANDAAKTNPPTNNNQTVLPISAQGTFG